MSMYLKCVSPNLCVGKCIWVYVQCVPVCVAKCIDLLCVHQPASWGTIFLLHTQGCAEGAALNLTSIMMQLGLLWKCPGLHRTCITVRDQHPLWATKNPVVLILSLLKCPSYSHTHTHTHTHAHMRNHPFRDRHFKSSWSEWRCYGESFGQKTETLITVRQTDSHTHTHTHTHTRSLVLPIVCWLAMLNCSSVDTICL